MFLTHQKTLVWYWIGLSDSASEGTWLWLSDNRANPDDGSLWHPGYPRTGSSGNNNGCAVAIFLSGGSSGLFVWAVPCSINYRALCEKPV